MERYNDIVSQKDEKGMPIYTVEEAFKRARSKDKIIEEAEEVLQKAARKIPYQPTLPLPEFEGITHKEPITEVPKEAVFAVPKEQLSFGRYLARRNAISRRIEKHNSEDTVLVGTTYQSFIDSGNETAKKMMKEDENKLIKRAREYAPDQKHVYARIVIARLIRKGKYKPTEEVSERRIQSEIDALGRIGCRTEQSPEEREHVIEKAKRRRLGGKEKRELSRQYPEHLNLNRKSLTDVLKAAYEKRLEAIEAPFETFNLPTYVLLGYDHSSFIKEFIKNPPLSAIKFEKITKESGTNQTGRELDEIFREAMDKLGMPETQEDFNAMLDLTYQEFLKKHGLK